MSTGVDPGFVFVVGSVNFTINACLTHKELDSSQFNNHPRFELITQIFTILFLKLPHDKICLLFCFNFTRVGLVSIQSLVLVGLFGSDAV